MTEHGVTTTIRFSEMSVKLLVLLSADNFYNRFHCRLCTAATVGLLRKTTKKRISAFEMKCLRQFLRVSWPAKRTNEWVLETAGVSRSLYLRL